MRRLRSLLLLLALLAPAFAPTRAAPKATKSEIAAQLKDVEAKIARAESMRSAINANPDGYDDVPQTLKVLAETIDKLRATERLLRKELKEAGTPAPPVPAREKNVRVLESRIAANGASKEAVARAKELMRRMLAGIDDAAIQRMVDQRVTLELVPKGKKLLDLPDLAALKGSSATGGGSFNERGGVSDVIAPDGKVVTAVWETNLTGAGTTPQYDKGPSYPKDFLMYHEFAHAVHLRGVAADASKAIKKAHRETQKQPDRGAALGRSGLGTYADADAAEHFAQAAAAYFGAGFQGEKKADLKRLDPKMYDQVERAFNSKKGATP